MRGVGWLRGGGGEGGGGGVGEKKKERERERGKKREEKVRGCNVSSLSLSHQQSSIVCVSYRSLHPTE